MALLDEIEWHLDQEDASLREGRREPTIFLMRLGYPEEGLVFLSDCERFLVRLHAFVHRRFGLGRLAVPEEFEALPPINPDQLEIGMP